MLDILLLALQIVTLILLFLFIWWVVRSARGDLDRSAQRPPPQAVGWDGRAAEPRVGGYAAPPPVEPSQMAAGIAVADWAVRPEQPPPADPGAFDDEPALTGESLPVGRDDAPVAPLVAAGAGTAAAGAGVAAAQAAERTGEGGTPVAPAPSAGADVRPRLLVESSPTLEKGAEIPLSRWLGMGRSSASDLPLDDPFVSATHARVGRRDDVTFVEDLGSTNGTFVNERRVTEEQLRPGSRLRVGETVFRYEE